MPSAPDRKPSSPASARPALFPLAAVVIVAVAAMLAWGHGLPAPFEMDDHPSILENASIRRLWPPGWLQPPAAIGETVGGRPVLNFTFALNHALGGLDVRGYRLVNVLIHAGAALALFGIVRRTVEWGLRGRLGGDGEATPPVAGTRRDAAIPASSNDAGSFALVVALLWLLHPLQTESVTYVVQRAESLCGLFILLTLYAFVRGVGPVSDRPGPANSRGWLALSALFCLLAVGTKEVAVTVPVLVLFYDRTFVAGGFRAAWRARRGYYLVLASTWIVLLALVASTGGNRGGTSGLNAEVDALAYWLTQSKAVTHYLALSFWPQPLVFEYGTFWMTGFAEVLPYAVLVLALGLASLVALWRRPVLGFLGFWFFGILAPTSLVPGTIQMIVEHRMYLPLAAVIVLVCAAVRAGARAIAARRGPRARWVAFGVGAGSVGVILALGGATFARNQVYRSELALWQDTVTKRPDNPRAHHNLGMALLHAGRVDEAEAGFRRAVALQPNHAFARFQLGTIHLNRRQWAAAAHELQLALAADPHYHAARVNLGQALTQLGRFEEAAAQYRAVLADEPGAQDARTNLAAVLVAQGRTTEGETLLREAIGAAPELAEAHYHLGLVLEKSAGARAAEAEFREAVRLKPGLATAHLALAKILATRGDIRGAEASCQEAMRLDAASAEARYVWGNLLARQQRMDEALAAFHEALRLDPRHVPARNNLANCQLVTGRLAEAIANYEAVLRARPGDAAVRRNLELARETLAGR